MRLVAVLGYSDGRGHGLHPICAARLELAGRLAKRGDSVVLTGGSRRAGAPAEAELMRRSWRGADCSVVCDTSACITAENAVCVARLARELGAHEIVVVTSWWHRVRAALLFHALAGMPVSVVSAGRPWSARLLVRELGAFVLLPFQLRRARSRASGRAGA
jgi:uncharacterized SAM-binding protein YcdF (DUF218 family)